MDLTLINTLDIHSGTITAIATIALAIVTVFLVKATIQLADISKNQDKPWLHFYYMYVDDRNQLYVKNIGKGAALEVEFTVKNGGLPAHQQKLDALAPSQEFVVLSLPSDDSNIYEIDEIMYKDINKNAIKQQKIDPKIMNIIIITGD